MKEINSACVPHVMSIMKELVQMEFMHLSNSELDEEFDRSEKISVPENNIPVVVLIGGVQGSGKSAFINFCASHMDGVYEESTIDCCKQIVKIMANIEGDSSSLNDHIETKDDCYRTLLNDLKKIWCEADDGPNTIACNTVNWIVNNKKPASIIFMNVREPEQIAHLKRRLIQECNVLVLTLAVLRNDVSDTMNSGDAHTLDYNYDIYIKNSRDLEYLDTMAIQFCRSIVRADNLTSLVYINAFPLPDD